MDLQRADCGNHHDHVRYKTRSSALDVEESLATHGEIKASFGNNKPSLCFMVFVRLGTRKFQRNFISQDGAIANANVCKRTSMDKDWSALQALHQIRLHRVPHECGESAASADVVASDRVSRL